LRNKDLSPLHLHHSSPLHFTGYLAFIFTDQLTDRLGRHSRQDEKAGRGRQGRGGEGERTRAGEEKSVYNFFPGTKALEDDERTFWRMGHL